MPLNYLLKDTRNAYLSKWYIIVKALMPRKREDMSYYERKKTLRYLMFLKARKIKACGCADRSQKRLYIDLAKQVCQKYL